jgi:hypothetical protein
LEGLDIERSLGRPGGTGLRGAESEGQWFGSQWYPARATR